MAGLPATHMGLYRPYTHDELVAQCNAMFAHEAERERLREFLRTPREKAMKAFAQLPSSNIDPELHALRGGNYPRSRHFMVTRVGSHARDVALYGVFICHFLGHEVLNHRG